MSLLLLSHDNLEYRLLGIYEKYRDNIILKN